VEGDKTETKMLPLQYKNFTISKDGMFKKNDSLSIHLRTAYIKHFSEWPSYWRMTTRTGVTYNGEIAIVANAFEMATGKELDFKNMEAGRLVFFSDDVQKGQPLNLNNIPIYGPITYNGAPVAFRISIFELDIVSEQAKAIIGLIAKAGSVAYPPASPILGMLNGLGNGLVSGEQNDTEFRYTMVLDPRGGSEDLNHFVLEVGNYVFIRMEKRTKEVPWDKLALDENKGIVYWKNETIENGKKKPYTENTYLIVEINKDTSSINIDLSEDSYTGLLDALKDKDAKKAASIKLMTAAVTKALVPRTQMINFNTEKDLLHDIKDPNKSIDKKQNTEKLLVMIKESIDSSYSIEKMDFKDPADIDIKNPPNLSQSQIEYLVSKLRKLENNPDLTIYYIATTDKAKLLTDFNK
jgi:hypothetical protein